MSNEGLIYLGMLTDEAKTFMGDGRPAGELLGYLGSLTPEHFPAGPERDLFATSEDLIGKGTLPVPRAIEATNPALKAVIREALEAIRGEGEIGSFTVARQAVERAALKRDVHARITQASELYKAGDLTAADARMREESRFTLDRLTPLRQDTYASNSLDDGSARFIATPWQPLTDSLGGGYGVGGTFAVTMVIAQTGGGKALPLDTPIATPRGWKTMADLRAGDQVFGADGKPTEVAFTSEVMHDHKVYRVRFSDGSSLMADGGHLWTSWTRNARARLSKGYRAVPTVLTTEQMLESLIAESNKYRNHAIQTTQPVAYPEQDLPLDPYVLGAWLGDGHSECGRITIGNDSLEILDNIRSAGFSVNKQSGAYLYQINGLKSILRQLDIRQNKHIPARYLIGGIEQRLSLLQGLMDTDGTCDAKTGTCTFDNKNEDLVDGVVSLAHSLGIKAKKISRRTKLNGRDCGVGYRVSFTTKLPVFRLTRKLERLPKSLRATAEFRYVVAIEPVESVPVKCIGVSAPDRLFLAGENYVVTHNSTWARQQIPYFLEHGHRVLYFAGESLQDEVLQDIYALTAGVSKDALRMKAPITLDKYDRAWKYIQRFPKGLHVVAGARFTVDKITSLAAVHQADLARDRAEGRAKPEANLLVIVDNLDHAVHRKQNQSEWDAYDQAAHDFAESASHGGYGLMCLAQPSSEGASRLGPAYEYDIQGGKRVANSASTILSLWRPLHAAHREAKEKNGEPAACTRPWIAKRKCRANGAPDELPFDTTPFGLWYPEGSRPILRNLKTGTIDDPAVAPF